MRRFLVVGCGGSGGATLAYMMDQLRSDLASHGVKQLPQGWQFVHLDVPTGEEAGPDGVGNVREQGGHYHGLGPRGGGYTDLDYAVSETLRAASALDSIGTWAPRKPRNVTTPIAVGAGQYRAVGRMITLSKVGEMRQGLQKAWDDLQRVETSTEMADVSRATGSRYDSADVPVVLVVSSMAGGAGASMALDVCRLLTLVDGVDPQLMGVFMVSPDIFETLPPAARGGVRANALAMLGEIVASQAGAAREHDVHALRALGLSDGEGAEVPFARVFPVGRFVGAQRTLFGDGTPNAVYRGLSRGLSGLMMSDVATHRFVAFDLGNASWIPPNSKYLAWGAALEPIPWGSFGFASLSMGRDRYAEYAAQRISRSAVDRLLDGHLQTGSDASGTEQAKALLDSQWESVCTELQLPTGLGSPQQQANALRDWMTQTALPREQAESHARTVTERELSSHLPSADGQQGQQWLTTVNHRIAARQHGLASAANDAAVNWAFAWQQGLLRRIEQVVTSAVAKLGIAYAVTLINRLQIHLRDVIIPGAETLGGRGPSDLTSLPAEVTAIAERKGVIANGTELVSRVVDSFRVKCRTLIYARASALAGEILKTMIGDVLQPLEQALRDNQTLLEQQRATVRQHDGLARLATDQYGAWPSDQDQLVPARFAAANNEVLLTPSGDFPGRYRADLKAAVPAQGTASDPAELVVTQVIRGIWQTTGGEAAPGGLLEQTSPWRTKAIAVDPTTGEPLVPNKARFDLHARPFELLERARQFVARPEESFDKFCSVSLREFVLAQNLPDHERARRRQDIGTKFSEALALALPLIGAHERAVQILHGKSVEYRYKFSEVPFKGLDVAEDLQKVLTTNAMIDASSLEGLAAAFTDQGSPRRIDIFGSYPLYSPLVFDSVLKPVVEQWSATLPQGRDAFWTYRRARPLDAALPMAAVERRAMVAGWFIGQIIGQIKIPAAPFTDPVEIWDAEQGRWLGFPHPLLTPPQRFTAQYDWLPAVLESYLLAIARVHESPLMGSLRPYHLLRELYDDSVLGPAGDIMILAAKEQLATWLRSGNASGGVSRVPGAAEAETVAERASLAASWLRQPGDLASEHFMPAGLDGAPGGGKFATITSREQAAMTPLFRDLAPDIRWATKKLTDLLIEAEAVASAPAAGAPGPQSQPPSPEITIPEGGVF